MKEKIKIEFMYDTNTELEVKNLSNSEIDKIISESTNINTELRSLEIIPDINIDIDTVHNSKNPKGRTWEIHVVTIGNWPEFKTKTCYKWVDIPLDGRTKIPYPCVWTRTCKRAWYLRIVYSGGDTLPIDIEKIIKDCAKTALIPSIPLLLTGNIGAATSAFLSSFKTCLISKGIQQAANFSVGFKSRATCGKWRRV
ncbi:hypothetical protein [Abyssalbus ytuae]|uniref:Uncharacterized protein n=1 Tax=Abyssalbus ytuae TaxID=2926907 RepID=A0A9E7CU39_9FLAO|nr:hypothetical protein [Abyssalbus ytuae]UOB19361.1 hypothetical protein MQE35_08690 [Abyssalbus ytuae]